MNKKEIIKSYVKENPHVSQRELARVIHEHYPEMYSSDGVVRQSIRRLFPSEPQEPVKPKEPVKPPEPKEESPFKPLSLDEIRSAHDIRVIVLSALQTINKGEFWTECDFVRKNALMGRPGFRSMLESDQCKPYKGKNQGKVYYGHPESIYQLKQEGVLL